MKTGSVGAFQEDAFQFDAFQTDRFGGDASLRRQGLLYGGDVSPQQRSLRYVAPEPVEMFSTIDKASWQKDLLFALEENTDLFVTVVETDLVG